MQQDVYGGWCRRIRCGRQDKTDPNHVKKKLCLAMLVLDSAKNLEPLVSPMLSVRGFIRSYGTA